MSSSPVLACLPFRNIAAIQARSTYDEACANRVVAINGPACRTQDAGCAFHGRTYAALAVQIHFAQQAAFKRTASQQAFGLDRLVDTQFAACFKHSHHGAGAGTARRAIQLAAAEYVHILVESAFDGGLVPESDEV